MKKAMIKIFLCMSYAFYFLLTVKQRREYIQSELNACDCYDSRPDGLNATIFYFNPDDKPKRRYLIFNEFKKSKELK